MKPTVKGAFEKNASFFDITIYVSRDREYKDFKDELLVQFKDRFENTEFVIIGTPEEKDFFINFQTCINNPGDIAQINELDKLTNDISNLLSTIKSVINTIKDVAESPQKSDWLAGIASIIFGQSGFVSQISKMKECYAISKLENEKLATKLAYAYKPYFGFNINYEIGGGFIITGNV